MMTGGGGMARRGAPLTFDDGAGQVPPASSATILVCAIGSTES
jgi:hypothetical protein